MKQGKNLEEISVCDSSKCAFGISRIDSAIVICYYNRKLTHPMRYIHGDKCHHGLALRDTQYENLP